MSMTPPEVDQMADVIVERTGRSFTKVRAFLNDIEAICDDVERAERLADDHPVAEESSDAEPPKWDSFPGGDWEVASPSFKLFDPPASYTPTEAESISGVELHDKSDDTWTFVLDEHDWLDIESALNRNGYYVSRNPAFN